MSKWVLKAGTGLDAAREAAGGAGGHARVVTRS